MKKIMLIAFMLLMPILGMSVTNHTDYDLRDTYNTACELLGIDTSIVNIVIVYMPEHISRAGEYNIYGATLCSDNGTCTISLRKNLLSYKVVSLLAHELIHVKQFKSGRLLKNNDGTTMWDGEKLDSSEFDIYDPPWEKEARSESKKIFKIIMSEKRKAKRN